MKVIAAVLVSLSLFGGVALANTVGAIEWENVTPIWQASAFLDNFPILRWIITRNPDQRNGFMLGGSTAAEGQFPASVGLLFHLADTNGFCGGTLLNEQWVLTAAHCAQLSTSGIAVAGGVNIMNAANDNQQRVTFSHREINPLWDPTAFQNDLALIRLDTPFNLTEFVQPARLPNIRHMGSSFLNHRTTIAGWGSIAPWISPNMRFIRNQVMARFGCALSYPTMVGPFNICTSGSGASPCQGDSGVAITIQEVDSQETVIGALSFGSALGCGSSRPAVYTLVGPFLPWISQVTGVPLRENF